MAAFRRGGQVEGGLATSLPEASGRDLLAVEAQRGCPSSTQDRGREQPLG